MNAEKIDVTALREDGDTLELPDGRVLRLKFEPDDINPFEDSDCYGQIADGRIGYDADGLRKGRPDGFDGAAERIWPPQNSEPIWWQPPSDVKRSDPGFAKLREHVADLAAFGTSYVRVELLDLLDAVERVLSEFLNSDDELTDYNDQQHYLLVEKAHEAILALQNFKGENY